MLPYEEGSHYHRLREAITRGDLEIVMFVAPPRTGSTATGMWLANGRVDGHLVEPGARCSTPVSRLEDVFRDIHEYYLSRLACIGRPIKLAIKEIAQHIGPKREARQFFALARKVLILIRNPLLALESHLLLTAAIVTKLRRNPESIDQLRRWLVPNASVYHIDPYSPESVWDQHWRLMRASRDYSSLNHRIWLATNDMFTSRSLQIDVWENKRGQLAAPDLVAQSLGYRDWAHMTQSNYCASLDCLCSNYIDPEPPDEGTASIPRVLSDCFAYLQGGWGAIAEHYRTLRDSPNFAGIADFTTLQLLPDRCAPNLLRALGLEEARAKRPPIFWSGYGQSSGVNLEETLFGRDKTWGQIQPPRHSPIAPNCWPPFLRQHLPEAVSTYVQLSSQAHKPDRADLTTEEMMSAPIAGQPGRTIIQTDPTHAYCLVKLAADLSLQRVADVTGGLRALHPDYAQYFDMIDGACSQRATNGIC